MRLCVFVKIYDIGYSLDKPEAGAQAIVGFEDQDEATGCGSSCCTVVLVIVSVILVIMFFPFSLMFLIKV